MTRVPSLSAAWLVVAAALAAPSLAGAQPRAESVTWTAAPVAGAVSPGGKVVLNLRGDVQEGWHVYGLKQLPTGPTQLVVAVDSNSVAASAGAATGSAPIKKVDPAFGLETQFYDRAFTLSAPVKVSAKAPLGAQTIPVSVRFQTCNGEICQPPKTVRLSVPVTIKAAS